MSAAIHLNSTFLLRMMHSIFVWILVWQFCKEANGQVLSTADKEKIQEVLMEQRILENIRSAVLQLCQTPSDLFMLSTIQNLTTRLGEMEKVQKPNERLFIYQTDLLNLTKRIEAIEKISGSDHSTDISLQGIHNLTTRVDAIENTLQHYQNSEMLTLEIQSLAQRIEAIEKKSNNDETSDVSSPGINNITRRIKQIEQLLDTNMYNMTGTTYDVMPSLVIQNLTEKIRAVEESLSSRIKRMECVASFGHRKTIPALQIFEDRCYYIGNGFLNWTDAQAKCQSDGANLLTDPSQEFTDKIREKFENSFWIGARNTNGVFRWISTGGMIADNDSRWKKSHSNHDSHDLCVNVFQNTWKWYGDPCNYVYHYVCEL